MTTSDVIGQRRDNSPTATGEGFEAGIERSERNPNSDEAKEPEEIDESDSPSSGKRFGEDGIDFPDDDDDGVEIEIPERTKPVGSVEVLTDKHMLFLRMAYDLRLPCRVQLKNPKTPKTHSFNRYEKYKTGSSLKVIHDSGGTWDDIKWDYARGFIDFKPSENWANVEFAKAVDQMKRSSSLAIPTPTVDENGFMISTDAVDEIDRSVRKGVEDVFELIEGSHTDGI